jgi:hypothetical protein
MYEEQNFKVCLTDSIGKIFKTRLVTTLRCIQIMQLCNNDRSNQCVYSGLVTSGKSKLGSNLRSKICPFTFSNSVEQRTLITNLNMGFYCGKKLGGIFFRNLNLPIAISTLPKYHIQPPWY